MQYQNLFQYEVYKSYNLKQLLTFDTEPINQTQEQQEIINEGLRVLTDKELKNFFVYDQSMLNKEMTEQQKEAYGLGLIIKGEEIFKKLIDLTKRDLINQISNFLTQKQEDAKISIQGLNKDQTDLINSRIEKFQQEFEINMKESVQKLIQSYYSNFYFLEQKMPTIQNLIYLIKNNVQLFYLQFLSFLKKYHTIWNSYLVADKYTQLLDLFINLAKNDKQLIEVVQQFGIKLIGESKRLLLLKNYPELEENIKPVILELTQITMIQFFNSQELNEYSIKYVRFLFQSLVPQYSVSNVRKVMKIYYQKLGHLNIKDNYENKESLLKIQFDVLNLLLCKYKKQDIIKQEDYFAIISHLKMLIQIPLNITDNWIELLSPIRLHFLRPKQYVNLYISTYQAIKKFIFTFRDQISKEFDIYFQFHNFLNKLYLQNKDELFTKYYLLIKLIYSAFYEGNLTDKIQFEKIEEKSITYQKAFQVLKQPFVKQYYFKLINNLQKFLSYDFQGKENDVEFQIKNIIFNFLSNKTIQAEVLYYQKVKKERKQDENQIKEKKIQLGEMIKIEGRNEKIKVIKDFVKMKQENEHPKIEENDQSKNSEERPKLNKEDEIQQMSQEDSHILNLENYKEKNKDKVVNQVINKVDLSIKKNQNEEEDLNEEKDNYKINLIGNKEENYNQSKDQTINENNSENDSKNSPNQITKIIKDNFEESNLKENQLKINESVNLNNKEENNNLPQDPVLKTLYPRRSKTSHSLQQYNDENGDYSKNNGKIKMKKYQIFDDNDQGFTPIVHKQQEEETSKRRNATLNVLESQEDNQIYENITKQIHEKQNIQNSDEKNYFFENDPKNLVARKRKSEKDDSINPNQKNDESQTEIEDNQKQPPLIQDSENSKAGKENTQTVSSVDKTDQLPTYPIFYKKEEKENENLEFLYDKEKHKGKNYVKVINGKLDEKYVKILRRKDVREMLEMIREEKEEGVEIQLVELQWIKRDTPCYEVIRQM